MFGWLHPKSTVTDEQRTWIETRFAWLLGEFGRDLLIRPIITPTDEFFPDRYTGTHEDAAVLFGKVCGYMNVEPTRLELAFYTAGTKGIDLEGREYALGAYVDLGETIRIWLEQNALDEPMSVVRTLAHELGHVHLLGDGRYSRDATDHEPLTDLLTVFFGMGIFAANCTIKETSWTAGNMQGWSTSRSGYLTGGELAYALALFAASRQETRPDWAKHLRPDVRGWLKTELKSIAARRVVERMLNGEIDGSEDCDLPDAIPCPDVADESSQNVGERTQLPGEISEFDVPNESSSTENSIAEQREQNADLFFSKGVALAAEGDYHAALAAYTESLKLEPRDVEVRLHRAISYLWAGMYKQAISDCTSILRVQPKDYAAMCWRARAYLHQNKFTAAKQDAATAIRIEPQNTDAHHLFALAHAGLGDYRQAEKSLKTAIQCCPTWSDNYLARSRVYEAIGKTKWAEADLQEAIRRNGILSDPAVRESRLASRAWKK